MFGDCGFVYIVVAVDGNQSELFDGCANARRFAVGIAGVERAAAFHSHSVEVIFGLYHGLLVGRL